MEMDEFKRFQNINYCNQVPFSNQVPLLIKCQSVSTLLKSEKKLHGIVQASQDFDDSPDSTPINSSVHGACCVFPPENKGCQFSISISFQVFNGLTANSETHPGEKP